VPTVADALSLVREAVQRGDAAAVRNVIEALFSDFLIGEAGQMPDALGIDPQAAVRARAALRERVQAMEVAAGRTVADAEAQAQAVADLLPWPEPAADPLADGLRPDGLIILPEPRRDALATVTDEHGPAILVDEHGRSLFRRLPLQTTHTDGLGLESLFGPIPLR
jgi:hypothetical protein